jgi:hypothetical protein
LASAACIVDLRSGFCTIAAEQRAGHAVSARGERAFSSPGGRQLDPYAGTERSAGPRLISSDAAWRVVTPAQLVGCVLVVDDTQTLKAGDEIPARRDPDLIQGHGASGSVPPESIQ